MSTSAIAQESCLQADALYMNETKGIRLEFKPLDGSQMTTANGFEMTFADKGLTLEGHVIWNQGLSRPNGVLLNNCPDGDATGEEIEACTVWQGVLYAVSPDGKVDFIPPEGKPAADQLLFPDLARAIRYSTFFYDKTELIPWDVFKLIGCGK